jgi:hypothetical protein
MQIDLDFNGIFLISSGTGIKNYDMVTLDMFALYNPEEKVAAG